MLRGIPVNVAAKSAPPLSLAEKGLILGCPAAEDYIPQDACNQQLILKSHFRDPDGVLGTRIV